MKPCVDFVCIDACPSACSRCEYHRCDNCVHYDYCKETVKEVGSNETV